MKFLIILIIFFPQLVRPVFAEKKTVKLWGTHLSLELYHSKNIESYLGKILDIAKYSEKILDPDCLYAKNKHCKKSEVSIELKGFLRKLESETLGYFSVNNNGKKDFGGLAQGFVLQKFIDNNKIENIILDFGHDYYINTDKAQSIILGDPQMQILPLARLIIKKGWVLSSSSTTSGANIYIPKNKKAHMDFETIVLIASPQFSGARLDAWSTALIVGGKQLLEYLKGLKNYSGQWSYAYLDKKTQELICSVDLECKKNMTKSLYTIITKY